MRELINEEEYDRLSYFIQNKYYYCKKCDMFYYIHPRKPHQCEEVVEYNITLELKLVYPKEDSMKTPNELALDIAEMICDEASLSGGVVGYKIKVDD